MDARLREVFPTELMRGDPAAFRAAKAKFTLSAFEQGRLSKLRRNALACVYATRRRRDQQHGMKQQGARVSELEQELAAVRDENARLRAELSAWRGY